MITIKSNLYKTHLSYFYYLVFHIDINSFYKNKNLSAITYLGKYDVWNSMKEENYIYEIPTLSNFPCYQNLVINENL